MKHLVAPHLVFSSLDAEGYQVIMPPIIRPALGTGVASEGYGHRLIHRRRLCVRMLPSRTAVKRPLRVSLRSSDHADN